MIEKFKNTANFLLERVKFQPEVGIILGSGLGGFANKIENSISFDYKEIPDKKLFELFSYAEKKAKEQNIKEKDIENIIDEIRNGK